MLRKLLIIACLTVPMAACNDPEPWPNSRRYQTVDDQIFYQAKTGAAENIDAAWTPSAMIAYDDTSLLYLAKGTRKLIQLDINTAEQHPIFDFSKYENRLNPSLNYDNTWGESLIRASEDLVVIAGKGRPLIWANLKTGEVSITGNTHHTGAVIPQDGAKLSDIDFSLLAGIGRIPDGFAFIFGSQVFTVSWDGSSPETLLEQPIKHLAGAMETSADKAPDPLNAKEAFLNLDEFTHIVELNGWLYFWENPALKAVRGDRMLTVTGDGYRAPDCTLEDFYAQAQPSSAQLTVYQGSLLSPYWRSRAEILKIDIENLDEQTGKATGNVSLISPHAGAIHQIVPHQNYLYTMNSWAGSFWKFDESSQQSTRFFGPESDDDRTESLNESLDSPYDPKQLISPLAIQTLLNGKLALVYSPTIYMLQIFSMKTGKSSYFSDKAITHLASDAETRAWYTSGSSFYYLYFDDLENVREEYTMHFFNPVPVMGVPCTTDVFKQEGNVDLAPKGNGILIYSAQHESVFHLSFNSNALSVLHKDGWVNPGKTDPYYNTGFQTKLVDYWTAFANIEATILKYRTHRWISLSNVTESSDIQIAGITLGGDKNQILGRAGADPVAEGLTVSDSSADNVTALSIDSDRNLYASTPNGIFRAGQDGIWQNTLDICPKPEFEIRRLSIAGQENERIILANTDNGIYACSQSFTGFSGISQAKVWTPLDAAKATACNGGHYIAYAKDHSLCSVSISSENERCEQRPDQAEITGISCNSDSIEYATDESLIYRTHHTQLKKIEPFTGNGPGLPEQIEIRKATLGTDIGKIATDDIPYLYFWMRDTCSIWKLPAYRDREIEGDTIVKRIVTDEKLCDASAFAVTKSGDMAFVHENTLYQIDHGTIKAAAALSAETLDMTGIGHGFVLLTTDGIYSWENGLLSKYAHNPIQIDGEYINYAVPASVYPRLVQSPGENAVLVPVFDRNRILRIAL